MESNQRQWMKNGLLVMILLALSPLAVASNLSDLKDNVSKTVVHTFSDFAKQLSTDSFGPIKLVQLEKILKAGENASISYTDPDTGAQLSVEVTPSSQHTAISFYVEGVAYEKLGVDYATGVSQLSEAIGKIKGFQSLEAENDTINREEAKNTQSMVGWQWRSGNFACRVAMSNADVMGGDLTYECHN